MSDLPQAPRSHWTVEGSTPNDGFECYFLSRDGLTVAEICGRQTDARTKHLTDLVSAANRPDATPTPSAPVAWFASNGNIRFWTSDEARAQYEKARGLDDLHAFTLAELVALAAPREPT